MTETFVLGLLDLEVPHLCLVGCFALVAFPLQMKKYLAPIMISEYFRILAYVCSHEESECCLAASSLCFVLVCPFCRCV